LNSASLTVQLWFRYNEKKGIHLYNGVFLGGDFQLSYTYVVKNKARQTQNFIGSKPVLPTEVGTYFGP